MGQKSSKSTTKSSAQTYYCPCQTDKKVKLTSISGDTCYYKSSTGEAQLSKDKSSYDTQTYLSNGSAAACKS